MPTAVKDSRDDVAATAVKNAVRTSLSLFESLTHVDRLALKDMLNEFLECDDDEERGEVAISIVEFLAPSGYFRIDDGVDLDEWINGSPEGATEVKRLTEQKEKFASKLYSLLAKQEMNQADLADKLGVKQPTISAILSGQHKPQPATLKKLADAFEVSVEEIWPR